MKKSNYANLEILPEHMLPTKYKKNGFKKDKYNIIVDKTFRDWDTNFRNSISILENKIVLDINMMKAVEKLLSHEIDINKLINNNFKTIRDLLDLIFVSKNEYYFSCNADFEYNNNNYVLPYHRQHYKKGFCTRDYYNVCATNFAKSYYETTSWSYFNILDNLIDDGDLQRIKLKNSVQKFIDKYKMKLNKNNPIELSINNKPYKEKFTKMNDNNNVLKSAKKYEETLNNLILLINELPNGIKFINPNAINNNNNNNNSNNKRKKKHIINIEKEDDSVDEKDDSAGKEVQKIFSINNYKIHHHYNIIIYVF